MDSAGSGGEPNLNDKQKKEAALEFAQLQPIRWDAFFAKWQKEHSEPTETVTVKPEPIETSVASPEPTIEVQETPDTPTISEVKKRKAVARKVKAADS